MPKAQCNAMSYWPIPHTKQSLRQPVRAVAVATPSWQPVTLDARAPACLGDNSKRSRQVSLTFTKVNWRLPRPHPHLPSFLTLIRGLKSNHPSHSPCCPLPFYFPSVTVIRACPNRCSDRLSGEIREAERSCTLSPQTASPVALPRAFIPLRRML